MEDEERPAWYWKEKAKKYKEIAGNLGGLAIIGWVLFVLALIKSCQS